MNKIFLLKNKIYICNMNFGTQANPIKNNMFKKFYHIHLDLDGVFCDLNNKLSQLLNKPCCEITEQEWNDSLRKYTHPQSDINFFLDLDLLPWAKEFYLLMLQLNKREDITISFLTSISANKTHTRRVIAEKELWILKYLGDELPVVYSNSFKTKHEVLKKEYDNENDFLKSLNTTHILIDDFILQKSIWEQHGGVFIHHLGDLKQTYHKLIELI